MWQLKIFRMITSSGMSWDLQSGMCIFTVHSLEDGLKSNNGREYESTVRAYSLENQTKTKIKISVRIIFFRKQDHHDFGKKKINNMP